MSDDQAEKELVGLVLHPLVNKFRDTCQLASLWDYRMPDSSLVLVGNLGKSRLFIVQNADKKPGSKEPDWIMYLCRNEKVPGSVESRLNKQTGEMEFLNVH